MTAPLSKSANSSISPQQAVSFLLVGIGTCEADHMARNENECHFYQIRAAHKFGYSEPFSPEQILLNKGLSKIKAGKEVTERAWSLYDRFVRGQKAAHLTSQ